MYSRTLSSFSTFLFALAFFTAGPIPVLAQVQTRPPLDTALASQIITLTNTDRASQHIGAVKDNALLDQAAQKRADDMLARQYFSHTSPEGQAPWKWFIQNGYTYLYAAENLAMDFSDAASVEMAWMNSPTHRANIINAKYKDMGIGIARGIYQGKQTTIIVEFFGTQQSSLARR